MGEKNKYKFGIKVDTHMFDGWSFGSCISHMFGETYLFTNFAKWSISIGWLMAESEDEE